jgi:hypothetical protein
MSAVEVCRTARMGGHVQQCQSGYTINIAYSCCRNRHCQKCQGKTSRDWLAARWADLLQVGYFHVVIIVPQEIAAISLQNKATFDAILSRRRRRHCTSLPPAQDIWVRRSALSWCCTRPRDYDSLSDGVG